MRTSNTFLSGFLFFALVANGLENFFFLSALAPFVIFYLSQKFHLHALSGSKPLSA